MRFVWILNARVPHRIKFYSTQLSMLFYGWISKRERRILRIQILVISNTNGNIFNRYSLLRPGALKTDLLNFRWIFQTEFVRVGVLKTHLLPRKGKGSGGGRGKGERACRQTFEAAIPPSCNYPADHLSVRSLSVSQFRAWVTPGKINGKWAVFCSICSLSIRPS